MHQPKVFCRSETRAALSNSEYFLSPPIQKKTSPFVWEFIDF